jgi:hypothetical protein
MPRTFRHLSVLALSLALAFPASGGSVERSAEASAGDGAAASVLLAIDQNRATIVERIVNEWGDRLVSAGAGVNRDQLKEMLFAMRADQLFAASLAGSLDGLKGIMLASSSGAGKARIASAGGINAIGDASADLVYTPVSPCRLFDTRTSQGGLGTPVAGVRRTVGAITPVASQGGPGGCSAGSGATVALILIGTLSPSGPGILQGGPQGTASFPNALILYQPGDQYGTSVAMPLNPANGQFDLQELFGTADVYGDLLGYFAPPAATALDCANQQSGSLVVNHGTFGDRAVSCATGYSLTGGGCTFFNLDDSTPTQNTVIVNRSAQTRDSTTGAFLPTWACRMTNNDPTTDFKIVARAVCCRVPGR